SEEGGWCILVQRFGRIGYIRISAFTNNLGEALGSAISQLEAAEVGGYVLDLRDNPGGVVGAGMDAAQGWLDGGSRYAVIEGRAAVPDGKAEASIEIPLDSGAALTRAPTVLLVNGGTASTSELLAGALHDELNLTMIGERTFGKGRTQTVFPLEDGSLLLLTTARFYTPAHTTVDGVGLTPQVACAPQTVLPKLWQPGDISEEESLLEDPCVRAAMDTLLGPSL
ncbi:hypothetical protein CYMTET_44130, partial [Cymbomonas tetramitiformis]